MNQKKKLPMTPFDMLVTTEELQMMKLLLPYVPAKQQKLFAVFIKLEELKNALYYFQHPSESAFFGKSRNNTVSGIFQEIRPYMNEGEAEGLDTILSAMNMMEMMQNLSEDINFSDFAKSMMPSGNEEMFDIYQEFLSKGVNNNDGKATMDTMDEQPEDERSGPDQTGTDPNGI